MIDVRQDYLEGTDLNQYEKIFLSEITDRTGFQPQKNIWRSSYFGTNSIGASHWKGTLNGQPALLKIQGVKPPLSEVSVLETLSQHYQNPLIRPPLVFAHLPWSSEQRYEAIIMEYISGARVYDGSRLQDPSKVKNFYSYYSDYRQNLLPKAPWHPKPRPKKLIDNVLKYSAISVKAYPIHPFRQPTDMALITKAINLVDRLYTGEPLEFCHCHFTTSDLYYENPNSQKTVIFSNLFWGWQHHFFDAVIAYHWVMFEAENILHINSNQIDTLRHIWLEELYHLPTVKTKHDLLFLKAAILYYDAMGLLIDGFLMNPKRKITRYIFDSVRNEIQSLLKSLT